MVVLSRLADYGVAVALQLAHLAANGEGGPVTSPALARDTRLPKATVAKILKALTRAGIMSSVRGANGGYRLAKPTAEITLAQLVAALDGPMAVTQCTSVGDPCERDAFCRTRAHWKIINNAIATVLSGVTIADMVTSCGCDGGEMANGPETACDARPDFAWKEA